MKFKIGQRYTISEIEEKTNYRVIRNTGGSISVNDVAGDWTQYDFRDGNDGYWFLFAVDCEPVATGEGSA